MHAMIIHTRYRDIPWEQIEEGERHHRGAGIPGLIWEAENRGKPVSIETPARRPSGYTACDGPHYHIAGTSDYVCPHIAEIGD